jgi:hypothetical protein
MANTWFVEETLPDHSYKVVARNLDEMSALQYLQDATTSNRLEVWSASHANGPKGFAPIAFRANGRVMISNTLSMLMGAFNLENGRRES